MTTSKSSQSPHDRDLARAPRGVLATHFLEKEDKERENEKEKNEERKSPRVGGP